MNWLKTDWQQPPPTTAETRAMWQSIQLAQIELRDDAINDCLDTFRKIYVSGDVELASFSIEADLSFAWYASRNRFDEIDFFMYLISDDLVKSAIKAADAPSKQLNPVAIEWCNAFTFDGELASMLYYGGASQRCDNSISEIRQIVNRFCQSFYQHRCDEIVIYKTNDAWSEWFADMAWDSTWFIFDKANCTVSLLCMTDGRQVE